MSDASPDTQITGQFDDAAVSMSCCLPTGWVWRVVSRVDESCEREGRLTSRVSATSADAQLSLQIAASRMQLPMGLAPAVVYWSTLHQLAEVPEDDASWSGHPTLSVRSTLADDSLHLVMAAWIQVNAAVIEIRLDGPSHQRAGIDAAWSRVQQTFRCAPLEDQKILAPSKEPWWVRAQALRAQGRVDEAIALLEREADMAEALLMQAALQAERMRDALTAQQPELARAAWRQAVACAYAYASSATSGSEGAARVIERDRLLADIGPEPT